MLGLEVQVKDGKAYIADTNGELIEINSEKFKERKPSRFSTILDWQRLGSSRLEDRRTFNRKKVCGGETIVSPRVDGFPRPRRGLIILINGCGGSGKDTFVQLVTESLLEQKTDVAVYNVSTIDPIRKIEKTLATLNGEPYISDKNCHRKACAELKKIWDEQYDGSFKYLKPILERYDIMCYNTEEAAVVFIHVREPHNLQRLYDAHANGSLVPHCSEWDITSVLLYGRTNPEDFDNSSDRDVENFEYEVYIDNDASKPIESLKDAAEQFASAIDSWRNLILVEDSVGNTNVASFE